MNDEARSIRAPNRRQLRRLIQPSPGPRVMTVRGDAGLGKTTLLASLAEDGAAAGWRVLRVNGSTSEAALSLAGLHQLLRPLLGGADRLPPAQRSALSAAFGLTETIPRSPDSLQLYLACLTLLSQQADPAPLLLLVDDAQWIDQATLDVLGFVARRLADDPIAIALSSRESVEADLGPDSRSLDLAPLTAQESNRLLDLQPIPPTDAIRAMVLEQAAGNPLALVELARAAAADPTATAAWTGEGLPLTERLRRSFTASASGLPVQTQRALLLAAADDRPELDLSFLSRSQGLPYDVWEPARAVGLVVIADGLVTFPHPLVRSAIYQSSSPVDRAAAHRALATALEHHPDRQAWHLAAAASGPDEALAERLESIGRAAARDERIETAAAAWQRAAELSANPRKAAALMIDAARVTLMTGQVERVRSLADRALQLSDEPAVRGYGRSLQGWALSLTFQFDKTVALMHDLVEEWAGTDDDLAWTATTPAAAAAYYAGEDALYQRVLELLHKLNGGLGPWQAPDGMHALAPLYAMWCGSVVQPLTDRAAKLVLLREIADGDGAPGSQISLAAVSVLLDDPRQAVRLRDQAQATPALLNSGAALMVITWSLLDTGQWDDALEYAGRARTLAAIHPEPIVRASVDGAAAYIAACRGHTEVAIEDAMSVLGIPELTARSGLTARAVHAMGMAALAADRPDEAYDWLGRLVGDDGRAAHNREALFGLIDLAEAARRTGHGAEAGPLIEGVYAAVEGELSPRLLQARSLTRALLAAGQRAEEHFLAALAVADGGDLPFERARAQLGYGQWLHRERRDKDARPHLNAAAHVFRRLAATPWLEAATREQRAAGVRSDLSPGDALAGLSPSERQVVLLAAEGLTNPEIAARLFVSPRTVGSHLYRSFTKLGVSNRNQLAVVVKPFLE
jgi:DNA-binding CsgD family transcriptional regulator/tetratricopeptide (TPR) repeat protein